MESLRHLINFYGFNINIYGISYALSLIWLFLLIKTFLKKEKKENLAAKCSIYTILGLIIGARIAFFYYSPSSLNSLYSIFKLWEGGMSFYGGAIGALLGGYLFCKKNNISFLKLADYIILPATILLIIGRIANLFNQEIIGTLSNNPWCINLTEIFGCRHPIPIYYIIESIFLFFIILIIKKISKKEGIALLSFTFLYSVGRIIIDIFRDYSLSGISQFAGQLPNILFAIISLVFIIYLLFKK